MIRNLWCRNIVAFRQKSKQYTFSFDGLSLSLLLVYIGVSTAPTMAKITTRSDTLQSRKLKIVSTRDDFVTGIPKLELHVHIEGTMGPELQWNLAQRNGMEITSGKDNTAYETESQLKNSYNGFLDHESFGTAEGRASFFNSYYGGFEVLRTEADFYDLAVDYFRRAGLQNIRYCEPFFDVQGHTRRGVAIDTVMKGLKRAQIDAEKRFNVSSYGYRYWSGTEMMLMSA